ncbi:hypothetical protein [Actinocatenispora sera]|uniref:Uncharacterized protein n=1 Tax=Actinocatenispora sera TaxID=390989 RepID=A0A810KX72_9ACTN|nr:hypothetical protein [Actinocatenispora sera]BCJ27032.1 hypothetical protein Asera_11400 [Actinocatenispora sera]
MLDLISIAVAVLPSGATVVVTVVGLVLTVALRTRLVAARKLVRCALVVLAIDSLLIFGHVAVLTGAPQLVLDRDWDAPGLVVYFGTLGLLHTALTVLGWVLLLLSLFPRRRPSHLPVGPPTPADRPAPVASTGPGGPVVAAPVGPEVRPAVPPADVD